MKVQSSHLDNASFIFDFVEVALLVLCVNKILATRPFATFIYQLSTKQV